MTVSVYITGFGAFGDVQANPTTELVAALEEKLQPNATAQVCLCVLPVSAQDVDAWQYSSLHPAIHQCVSNNVTQGVLVVHLGVYSKATSIRLEQCAYNTADFRFPDANGWQPKGECIDSSAAQESCKTSALDLATVRDRLVGQGHHVELSQDPGRYVCNYIYYRSLAAVEAAAQSSGRPDLPVHAIFVHVPSFETLAKQQQLTIVEAIIKELLHEVNTQLVQCGRKHGNASAPAPARAN